MNARTQIPTEIQHSVLDRSRRRCALCIHFDHDWAQKEGQIAHLDRDPSNFAEDNLAFLCLPHHDDYDTQRRQTKNLTIREAKTGRDRLYAFIEGGGDLATAGQQLNEAGSIYERRVDTITTLVPDLRKVVGYLQGMSRFGREQDEASPEQYCSACIAVTTSARDMFEKGSALLSIGICRTLRKFFASVTKAQRDFSLTQDPAVIIGGQRAGTWKAVGDIAYNDAPLILKRIEAAARNLINNKIG
jgi:hypothetical protein